MSSTNPHVAIHTNFGEIEAELFADKSPETVKNFLQYVDDKHYDHTIFHRVIDGFMIQGGGFTPEMKQKKTRDPVKNEADNRLSNTRGTLAMARTSNIHSATAQFFVNVSDNAFLDFKSPKEYGYAVFGKVTKGMDVVDRIKGVKTVTKDGLQNVPAETVEILSISQIK